MDLAVIFVIVAMCVSLFLFRSNIPHLTVFPSVIFTSNRTAKSRWIISFIGFFTIFLFSLTGATGLAVFAADGNGFCEEFNTITHGRCAGARSVIGTSWAAVAVGELTYPTQPISSNIPIGLFSYLRGPGFCVGRISYSRGNKRAS